MDDEKYLRDLFAGFAMCGWIMQRNYPPHEIVKLSYEMADAMMEIRNKKESYAEEGIAGITKRRAGKIDK